MNGDDQVTTRSDDELSRAEEHRLDAERGRVLVEESREIVVIIDGDDRVVAASRRAREAIEGLVEGRPLPESLSRRAQQAPPLAVPYELAGRRETLLYFGQPGDLAAYEELRSGFTAAVSHELRTPLARLLVLLDGTDLPDADLYDLIDRARREVENVSELIDDVLFLSELETGRQVVALGSTDAVPVLQAVVRQLSDSAERAGIALHVDGQPGIALPMRGRMLRVIAENLATNAFRYAGEGATFTLTARREGDLLVLEGADDGAGVSEADLSRLFERFYRADRARATRGTGLGLAIVKHIVTSAGGEI
jgi:two-component system phosphate regulon sensor histidine kinase PhoR